MKEVGREKAGSGQLSEGSGMLEGELPKGWVECVFENLKIFALGGDWGKTPDETLDDWEKVTVLRGTEFKNWNSDKGNTGASRIVKKTELNCGYT